MGFSHLDSQTYVRDRREAIGVSHTKAVQHSRLHELPKDVLALTMLLMQCPNVTFNKLLI